MAGNFEIILSAESKITNPFPTKSATAGEGTVKLPRESTSKYLLSKLVPGGEISAALQSLHFDLLDSFLAMYPAIVEATSTELSVNTASSM